MSRVVAFVPAKSSSDRVHQKNCQEILGVPLFLWAASNLARILPKDQIYIDTDGKEILDLANRCGFNTLQRPISLANNQTDGNTFFAWEVSQVKADIYIQHLPPMPFLRLETLEKGLLSVASGSQDSAFGCYKQSHYLWNNATGTPCYDIRKIPNSIDLEPLVIESMGIYIITQKAFETTRTRVGKRPLFLELEGEERIDIDMPSDLAFARVVANGLEPHRISHIQTALLVNKRVPETVKLVAVDVDGTLTDGGMYYTENGDYLKKFHTRDGRGIMMLRDSGIEVCLISSGRQEKLLGQRCADLGVKHLFCGEDSKEESLRALSATLGISPRNIVVLGDDVNDLPIMHYGGFSCCPVDAHTSVKREADLVLDSKGGHGCLRELADLLLEKKHARV